MLTDPVTSLLSATPALLLVYILADRFGPKLLEIFFPRPQKKTVEDRLIETLERTAASNAKLAGTMDLLQGTLHEHSSVLREISGAVAHLYGYLQLEPPIKPRD